MDGVMKELEVGWQGMVLESGLWSRFKIFRLRLRLHPLQNYRLRLRHCFRLRLHSLQNYRLHNSDSDSTISVRMMENGDEWSMPYLLYADDLVLCGESERV